MGYIRHMKTMIALMVLASSVATAQEEQEAPAKQKHLYANSEQETYDKLNEDKKMQGIMVSSLDCAAGIVQVLSKAIVAKEKRMARQTAYANPWALREARRLLEKSEEWKLSAARLGAQFGQKVTGCSTNKIRAIAACITITETDAQTLEECQDIDMKSAVKWVLEP